MESRSKDVPQTLIDILYQNALNHPHKPALTFLDEQSETVFTNEHLILASKKFASRLLQLSEPGARAIILLQPSVDYLIAFLGCVMAGVVAVPAYPPRNSRHKIRLSAVIDDAQAQLVITTSMVARNYEFSQHLVLVDEEAIDDYIVDWEQQRLKIQATDLAFLQYTSGSTGSPKGVMVSHQNVLANSHIIHELAVKGNDNLCSWLPPFHDMGLIGTILHPLIQGMHAVLMAPSTFLKKPYLWLKAISDYQVGFSPAPNFAYDLCVETITAAEKKTLDLSSWQVALNGSEPVNAKTLYRFAECFAECGFKLESCYPAYGMAEATLMISGKKPLSETTILHVSKQALHNNFIQPELNSSLGIDLVSCGRTTAEHDIKIINPNSKTILPINEIGEIVFSGPTVTQGYWQKPEINQEIFGLTFSDSPHRYLRTGDLGFIDEHGELYVTGRLKDLMIIRGQNIYPQDVEEVIGESNSSLIKHGGAAFTIEVDGETELAIVYEIHRSTKDVDPIIASILQRCMDDLPILPARIILIKQASLPKTSSGKVQRSTTRQALLDGELKIVAQWHRGQPHHQPQTQKKIANNHLIQLLQQWLAQRLNTEAGCIDPEVNFAFYGVDSSLAVQMVSYLEGILGKEINVSILWNYSTIAQLSAYLLPAGEKEMQTDHEKSQLFAEPIAIIGMSCRFPGDVKSIEEFWELLVNGDDGITEVPSSRWDPHLYAHEPINQGGFVKDIDQFDAQLFQINPLEAESMDPQHRLLLELTWEGLQNAGIDPLSLKNTNTAIFIGISSNDYSHLANNISSTHIDPYYGLGNAHSAAAGRLAYFLGTHGQTMAIDTACSSSLVALFNGCQDLQDDVTDLAIVGGVNIILDPRLSNSFAHAGMLSPKGRCQVFDADADGYVRSEGAGVIILKRLQDAQRDNDPILAVIESAVVNSDGHSNGITAPSPKAQTALVRKALSMANLAPDALDYLETHGTGTRLGDPIEFTALHEVFATKTRTAPLTIGSVKSNIGHLEAAAGLAGVIKTVLMLQHQKIAPNLHLRNINPLINLDSIPAQVATTTQNWPAQLKKIRYAGVSSFGFTGTNAHIILSESPPRSKDSHLPRPFHIFALSAHSLAALQQEREHFIDLIDDHPDIELASLCKTVNCSRSSLSMRLSLAVRSVVELRQGLEAYDLQNVLPISSASKLVFLFAGEGMQYTKMGWMLYQSHPLFQLEVDKCCELLKEYYTESFTDILFHEDKASLLHESQYGQPALFIIEYALARLWLSFGITPEAVLGHGMGAYVAATVAGVHSLAEGLQLVVARAKLMQRQENVLVQLHGDIKVIMSLLDELLLEDNIRLTVIAQDSPTQLQVAGDAMSIARLKSRGQEMQISVYDLSTPAGIVTLITEEQLTEFAAVTQKITYNTPHLNLISTIDGTPISQISSSYWIKHLRTTIKFGQSVNYILDSGFEIFLEVGPQPWLLNLIKSSQGLNLLPSLQRDKTNWDSLTHTLAHLYRLGRTVNWQAFDKPFRILPYSGNLPPYAFQHRRYWLPTAKKEQPVNPVASQALLQIDWEKIPLPVSNPEKIRGEWLIYVDVEDDDSSLMEAITSCFSNATVVRKGAKYVNAPTGIYVNPLVPNDFDAFLADAVPFTGIIYLCAPHVAEPSAEAMQKSIVEKSLGLVHLVQAAQAKCSLCYLVTCDSKIASHNLITQALTATAKSLSHEFVQINFHFLNFINTDAQACIQRLAPFINDDEKAAWVTLNDKEYCIPKLRPMLNAPEQTSAPPNLNKTFLITGGFGGIGLLLVDYLLQQGAQSIALIGRSPLDQLKQKQLTHWNSLGNVAYFQADVGDYEQLHQAFKKIQQAMPTVDAFFHAAGVLQDTLSPHMTELIFTEVCQPKIKGSWNLHRLSLEENLALEHFVVLSSVSSLVGVAGQTHYAAANGFMDALIQYRHQLNLPALSINFGPWEETGMTEGLTPGWLNYGIHPIPPQQGLSALHLALGMQNANLIYLPHQISHNHLQQAPAIMRQLFDNSLSQAPFHAPPVNMSSDWYTQLYEMPPQECEKELKAFLFKEVGIRLRLENIHELADKTLLALGMDSILATELSIYLRKRLPHLSITPQLLLFDNKTLNELVAVLHTELNTMTPMNRNNMVTPSVPSRSSISLVPHQAEMVQYLTNYPYSTAYHLPVFLKIHGTIDPLKWDKALNKIMQKNELLRASVLTVYEQYFFAIPEQLTYTTQVLSVAEADLEATLKAFQAKPFDLETAPLFRCALFEVENRYSIIAIVFHHVITDGTALTEFMEELLSSYGQNTQDDGCQRNQFQTYVHWLLEKVYPNLNKEFKDFWQMRLQGYEYHHLFKRQIHDVVLDKQSYPLKGAKKSFHLDEEALKNLKEYCARYEITLASLMQAMVHITLAQVTGKKDTCVVVFSSGRVHDFQKDILGTLVQHPMIRCQQLHEESVVDVARSISTQLSEMDFYQYMPSFKLKDFGLNISKISFDYEVADYSKLKLNGLPLEVLAFNQPIVELWGANPRHLSFKINETKNQGIDFILKYRLDIYNEQEAQVILNYCQENIQKILKDKSGNVYQPPNFSDNSLRPNP